MMRMMIIQGPKGVKGDRVSDRKSFLVATESDV